MRKLNDFIKEDSRIQNIYDYAKEKYKRANLPQHNWEHILRVLYRALLIAESQSGVDYHILIPSVLLHDIGYFEDNFDEHDLVGKKLVKRILPKFSYEDKEVVEISHCVGSHGGKEEPKTLEAKILFDADKLEKSGIGGAFSLYRAQLELGVPIEKFVRLIEKKMKKFKESGYYTDIAAQISEQGFEEYLKHLKEVRKSLEKRRDFLVTERDMWE